MHREEREGSGGFDEPRCARDNEESARRWEPNTAPSCRVTMSRHEAHAGIAERQNAWRKFETAPLTAEVAHSANGWHNCSHIARAPRASCVSHASTVAEQKETCPFANAEHGSLPSTCPDAHYTRIVSAPEGSVHHRPAYGTHSHKLSLLSQRCCAPATAWLSGKRNGSRRDLFLLLFLLTGMCLQTVQALPTAPSQLSVMQVTETSATITWTSVAAAEGYRLLNAPSTVGPYTTFKEYYAPPYMPAPNVDTLTNLIEGDMYFLKVLSGTADGQFETAGSPVSVVIPIASVRTAAKELKVVSYNTTFCRISWRVPGNLLQETGPAATHFALAYRCGLAPTPTIYQETFTSHEGTILADFVMDTSCQFWVISRNLNYVPSDPWSRASEASGKNKWTDNAAMTLLPNQPPAVTSLRPTAATLSSITVSFSPSANALTYRTSYAAIKEDGSLEAWHIVTTDVESLETDITGLTAYQLYRFRVQARNNHEAGYETGATIDVRVEGNPSPPILKIESVQSTALTLSWTPPESTHPLSYCVLHGPAGGGAMSVESCTSPITLTSITLSDLTQGVPITIYIRAKNLYGYGDYATITATPILPPSGRTTSINATLVSGQSERTIQLEFAGVQFADRYKIRVSENGGAYVDRGDIFMSTRGNISQLQANTTYSFKVYAGNFAGFDVVGFESRRITTDFVSQPTEAPVNLRILGLTVTSVLLGWDAPAKDMKVTSFRVEKSTSGTFVGVEAEVSNKDLTSNSWSPVYNATGLILGQIYYFGVTSRTANRGGYSGAPRSTISVITTAQPMAAVQNLMVVKIFPSSALLSWTALANEPVTKYRIQGWTDVGNSTAYIPDSEVDHPMNGGTISYEVTGLDTTSVYSFSVTARNYNIGGYDNVPSATIGDVRLMGLPHPPLNLRATIISMDSLSLAWDKSSVDPIATIFKVTYRRGTNVFDQHGLPELTVTRITITGLHRGSLYDFKVFAGTLAGYELQGSNLLTAAPVSRPKEVDALIITDIAQGSISLRWVPATFPRSTTFLITYADQRIETTQTSYTATGLVSGQPLTFSVFARNLNSQGYEPKGMTVVVTPIAPPGFVTTLRIVGVTRTSVRVEYDPIELVNVTKIKVQVKRTADANWTEYAEYQCRIDEQYLDQPPTCSTNIEIENLVLGVLYDVRVLQRNSNAAGYLEGGEKILIISPTLKPTRSVSNLQIVGVTTSEVFLEFVRPAGIDAPTHYKVVYSRADGGPEYMTEEVPTTQKTLNVTGLTKDVNYKFAIIGRNLNLDGYTNAVRSAVIIGSGFEKPSKVKNIANPGVGADRVTISWDPPDRGPVSLYTIEIANATTLVNGERVDVAELGLAPAYREVGTTINTNFTVIASETLTMEVDIKVILRVSARNLNVEGYGEPVAILAIPTAAPTQKPEHFILESVTIESALLSWRPPAGYSRDDGTIMSYLLEGCAENCGTNEPFPAAPAQNSKWYVMGGSEYEWRGYEWVFTGVTYWRTVAQVPFTQLSYNVTRIGEYSLQVGQEYQFRVSAVNKNTFATGPIAMLLEVVPQYVPGTVRKVVVSNPKITSFALNFVPPFVTNTSGIADRYRIIVDNLATGERYEYPEILYVTSAAVTGFNPGTEYRLTVYAGNLAGFETTGAPSFSTILTYATPCHKNCCEVELKLCQLCCGLQARRIKSDEVELVWKPPPNLALLHYRVEYQEFGLSSTWNSVGVFNSNTAIIRNLDKTVSDYKFRVTGGSRIKNTFDNTNQAGEVLVTTLQDFLLAIECEIDFVTATSVSVKFTRPYRPFSVYEIKYAVQISLDSFDENAYNNTRAIEDIADVDKGTFRTYEVTGLQVQKYYSFRVVSKTPYDDLYKDGIVSNEIRVRPEPQPPAVQNLRVAMVTLDLIKIAWEHTLEENTVTNFKVTWLGKGQNGTIVLPGDKFDFNISGLVSNSPYEFLVQARNWNKKGYEAGVKIIGVPQTTPPAPLNLRLIQYYSEGVELQWESNPNIPLAVKYEIQCRVEENPEADFLLSQLTNCVSGPASFGASFVKALEIDASSTFTLVEGLGSGYNYHFRVCAVGANYQGAIDSTCSDYMKVTPGPPPPASSLAVSSVTVSSITLSWSPASGNAESWSFIPGKDQPDYNIACPGGSVDDLKAACNADGGCVGFSTTGCLKSDLGLEESWIAYSSAAFAKGECCHGAGNPFGCQVADVDLSPKPVCGCQCKGMWRKSLQYLLQMARPPGPFANVQVGPIAGSFSTRISKPASCQSCALCPSSCVEVKDLALKTEYQFRLYTRNLNGQGYAGFSSNLVMARPDVQPVTAVTDLQLLYTSGSRAQLKWTGITVEPIIQYRVLASLDGVQWDPPPPSPSGGYVALDFVDHQVGENQGGAGLLDQGTKYWLKVEARNLNSKGYEGVISSNIVTAIPYPVIGPVLDLRTTESTVCTDISCCACCRFNLCRGIGAVTLKWKAPPGPITAYRIQFAVRSKQGTVGSFSDYASVTPVLNGDPPPATVTVTGLVVSTDYRFKVVAVSTSFPPFLPDCDSSSPPDQVCPSTVDGAPYFQPATSVESTLKVLYVTNGTITVEWNSILSEPVTRYQVSFGTSILQPDEHFFAEYDHVFNASMQSSIGEVNGPPESRLTAGLLTEQQSYFVYVTPRNLNAGGYATCPKTAKNIIDADLGDGSYKLTWTAPSHTIPIMSYRIWHRLNASREILSYAGRYDLLTPNSPLEYTVGGLTAGLVYEFFVIPSASPCAMIGPIVTTNKPNQVANFMLLKATETSIECSWSPSQSYNGYNLAQMYVLSSARLQGQSCESQNFTTFTRISATKNSHVFTGLQTMQSYCFRIFAENYHSQKSGAASYFEAKPMPLPYAPPLKVELVWRNNVPGADYGASVALKWVKPEIDRYFHPLAGEILHFKVAYWKKNEVTCLQKFVGINCQGYKEHPETFSTTSGIITGLQPDSEYYFKVYSGNSNGYDPDGSDPIGPISTSALPGPVLNLHTPRVTESSVILDWTMPTNPSPSKLKLMFIEHKTGRQIVEERSCTPLSPCPSTKTWTSLNTAFLYTFTVYTGGADDTLIPNYSEQTYSGVSSIVAMPYKATNSPRNLTKISSSNTGFILRFLAPSTDPLNGPVLDYFFEGRIGSGSWTYTSIGERLSPLAAGQDLLIVSIGGTPLSFQESYSFRVFAGNLFGNSTMNSLESISLYPQPSKVPSMVSTPKIADQIVPSYDLQWIKPLVGAAQGVGFEYVLEVSDDAGATFHADISSPFDLESNQNTVTFINKPRPERVQKGKAYLSRIRPRNSNTDSTAKIPATTLLLYTAIPPSAVQALALEYVTETNAAVSWQAPYNPVQRSYSVSYDLSYHCEVALYSQQPKFWALNETFANIHQTGIAFTLTDVRAALVRAGASLVASDSRFLMRIIPRNSAGISTEKNPSIEVWFVGRPEGKLRELTVLATRNGSVDISWAFPNTTEALLGFDILTSTDGLKFLRNKFVPSTYYDRAGVVQLSTSTTLTGLPVGKNWIHIFEVSHSDASVGYSLVGPALFHSFLETVPDLHVASVTAKSVLLRWGLSPNPILRWELSYTFGDASSIVGPVNVFNPTYNVTNLETDIKYTFFVRAFTQAGIGPANSVSVSTMSKPSAVTSLQVVQFDASGNLRLAWLVSPSAHDVSRRVRLAEENKDGNIGTLRTVSGGSTTLLRTLSDLVAGQSYRFVVESANLHQQGFGSPTILSYTVPSRPSAPTQVQVAFSLNDALIVKWTKPSTGSEITFYKVVTVKPSSEQIVQYHNAQTLLAEIQGLEPCILYTITVSSCNLAGCNAATQLTNQRTAPNQPVGLTTAAVTTTSITLSWSHPQPTNAYQYSVKYREVTTTGTTVVVDGRLVAIGSGSYATIFEEWGSFVLSDSAGSGTGITITGLTANRKYQFAVYVKFAGVDAAPTFIVGMPSAPPMAVTVFKVADDAHNGVTRDSLTIMWRAPAGSSVTHYDFSYWSTADSTNKTYHRIGVFEANENPDGSGDNFKTIGGLKPYQRYGFQIIARNLNDAGTANPVLMRDCTSPTDTLCTTTLPIPVPQPGRVQKMRLIESTIDSVTLEWDPPPSPDATFLQNMVYQVSYGTVGQNIYADVGTVTHPTTQIIISNIENAAGTNIAYNFRVSARNGNSKGFGPAKILLGMPNVVCAPTACKVRDLMVAAYSGTTGGAGSVTISWSRPAEFDTNPYLSFKYKVLSGGLTLIETESTHYTYQPINIGDSKTFAVAARTLNPSSLSNPLGFGMTVEVTATPRLQPAALTLPPTLASVSPSSVSLTWSGPTANANEYSYKIGWRVAGSTDGFLNPSYSDTTSVVVTGLSYMHSYEFKVFSRNLNSDGFEGYGSPSLTASPRATLGPPPNFRISVVTASAVTMSWEAHAGIQNAQYVLTFATQANHSDQVTVVDGIDVFSGTITGLTLGRLYYFSLRVKDIGGWSQFGYKVARTVTRASQVQSLAAFAIDADDSGLSWQPPTDLGSPSTGLSLWGYTIDVQSSGLWVNLGTSMNLRFNHHNISQRGVTYKYRVAALIKQDETFGYVLNPGTYSEISLFFGTAPIFVGDTPPHKKTMIAMQTGVLYVPLTAHTLDVPPAQLTFLCTGALPSVVTLSPTNPIIDEVAKTATQNLAVQFVPDLAGSEYYLCMQAQDSNGLRTEERCYTILLPLPNPKWLAPAPDSAYEARVGCTLTVGFSVVDRTTSDIDPAFAAEGGFIPQVALLSTLTESRYTSSLSTELPTGAALVTPASSVKNPSSTNFVWRLRKGQEGFWYRLCFSTSSANTQDGQLCISVTTSRCQYCSKSGDSLHRVAKEWHTSWTQIWSGNHVLDNPDFLMNDQIIQVGPIYTVRKDEDLDHIALRYGIDLQDLLLWNPDVADRSAQEQRYVIHELQELCIVPQSCVYAGSISSSPTISHAAL